MMVAGVGDGVRLGVGDGKGDGDGDGLGDGDGVGSAVAGNVVDCFTHCGGDPEYPTGQESSTGLISKGVFLIQ